MIVSGPGREGGEGPVMAADIDLTFNALPLCFYPLSVAFRVLSDDPNTRTTSLIPRPLCLILREFED
jgi:hypothetical protein